MKKNNKKADAVTRFNNTEELLKKSDEKYRRIVQLTSDWIWEIDEQGKYCYCTEKIENILGYTIDEIIGKSPFDFMPIEECERVGAIFKNISETKKPIINLENWNYHKDGHKVCLLTNGVPIFDEIGNIIGYKGADKDITQRKLAEKALQESEERWKFALEGAGDGVWDWNAQTNEVYFSQRWKSMLGYDDHEIGTTLDEWSKRLHPDDEKKVFEDLNKHFQKQTPFYLSEHRVLCKDGNYKWILARGKVFQWTDDGKPLRVIGTHTDITERKRMENLFKKNELMLRTVADHTYGWEYWISENNQFIYMSPSCEGITGYTREEFIANPSLLQSIVHPDDSDSFNRHHDTILINEQSNNHTEFEVRFIHKNGSIVFVQHICRPIFDENKKYLGRRVSNRDITEQKKTNEILHQLSQAVEQSPTSIVITDTTGSIKYVNPKFIEVTGYSFSEALGKNPRILKSGHTVQAEYEQLWTILKSGMEWKGEFHNRKKNGELYWESARISPIVDSQGTTTHFLAVKEDITQRKLAEEALQQSSKKWEAIMTSSPDGVGIESLNGTLLYASNKLASMFGYSQEEKDKLIGKSVLDFIDQADHKRLQENILGLSHSPGDAKISEYLAISSDNSKFFAEVHSTFLVGIEGNPESILFVLRDITERKRTEDSLKQYNLDLIEANKTVVAASKLKSEFVANMSHEIRTPINGIMGLTNLLLQTEVNEEQHSYLTLMKNSSTSLLTIINDILDFSKIEAGKLTIERIEFDLQHLVKETIALLHHSIVEKGLELHLEFLPETQTSFIGDPNRIRQVITNLTANAIKFTEHGSISVVIAKQEQYEESSIVRFSITDTGIGIPAQALGKIFQSFVQVNGSTTREYGGTGLGLAISKRLAELMGGTIGVDSVVGNGSTFWFTATLLNVSSFNSNDNINGVSEFNLQEEVGKDTVTETSFHTKDIKILVAEDNFVNQEVCKGMLRKLGYTPTIVSNGSEAVDEFKRIAYDIVLMDCQMPVMDGFEATTLIRNSERSGHRTPIIAVTANAFESDKDKCITSGMNDFFSKPFNQFQLNALLEQWIPKTSDEKVDGSFAAIVTDFQPDEMQYTMIDKKMVDGIISTDVSELQSLQDVLSEYFSNDVPEKLELFEQSLKISNTLEMKKIFHSLRGSSSQLGAFAAAIQCEKIETCITENDFTIIPNMIVDLKKILHSTKREYDHYLIKKRLQ